MIAVTSGKGGTGKTTLSTGLFYLLARHHDGDVQLLDCDVEEPDCHIFIQGTETNSDPVNILIPEIDPEKCTFCGQCSEVCAFQAILLFPPARFIEVSKDMCRGCGACRYVCPENAITERKTETGRITRYEYYKKAGFVEGRLRAGSAMQTRVIRETLARGNKSGIVLIDSPPGTSCPVVAVVSAADYVVMVAEPSPFGLHDLKLMVETVKKQGKDHGIVINKAGFDYPPLYDFVQTQNIPLLGEIPFKKELAMACSRGEVIAGGGEEIRIIFTGIINSVLDGKTL